MLATIPAFRTAFLLLFSSLTATIIHDVKIIHSGQLWTFAIAVVLLIVFLCLHVFKTCSSHIYLIHTFSFVALFVLLFELSFLKKDRELLFISSINKEQVILKGRIKEYPYLKGDRQCFLFSANSIQFSDKIHVLHSGTLLKVLVKDTGLLPLNPGHQCCISGIVRTFTPPRNPGEFNYARLMFHRNVLAQLDVGKSTDVEVLDKSNWIGLPLIAREYLSKKLDYAIRDSQSRSVASAMLLGERLNMDQEVLDSYSATGTTHVLSVSGLHVGILFLILSYLLKLISVDISKTFPAFCLVLFLIWFYAFLTGFSASVVRSALMFTIHLAGKFRNRKMHPLNTLGASAVLLLIADPFMLRDLGFQLSYLALLGIMLFYPLFQNWITNEKSLTGRILSVVFVSIAAQTFTLPISLYYFNQFPNFFIPANILIMPLSFLIMVSGMLLLVYPMGFPGFLNLGQLLELLITVLNQSLKYLTMLPHSVSRNLYPDVALVTVLFLIMTGIWLIYQFKSPFWLIVLFLLTAFVPLKKSMASFREQCRLKVYSFYKASLIVFENRNQWVYYSKGLIQNNNRYLSSFLMKTIENRVCRTVNGSAPDLNTTRVCLFRQKRIGIVPYGNVLPDSFRLNYLVITTGNLRNARNQSLNLKNSECIILDGSLSYRERKKIKDELHQTGIQKNVWDVSEKGAFVVDL